MFDYQLIRSARRKTLGLQVKQGSIIVRAPSFLTDKQIATFVNEKSAWLKSKVDLQKSSPACENISFAQGSMLWLNGEQKKLVISFQAKGQVLNLKDELKVILPIRSRIGSSQMSHQESIAPRVKKQLELWFKEQLHSYLLKRLPQLSLSTQLHAKSFKVRQYKARWGSCNNRGELSFNYLLMMTPQWVVDYVIIHELCHLKHLNHSKQFWQLVAEHSPYYLEAKAWLKTHQTQLTWS